METFIYIITIYYIQIELYLKFTLIILKVFYMLVVFINCLHHSLKVYGANFVVRPDYNQTILCWTDGTCWGNYYNRYIVLSFLILRQGIWIVSLSFFFSFKLSVNWKIIYIMINTDQLRAGNTILIEKDVYVW